MDVMLISETHFTQRSYFKIPNYALYFTNHPYGTAHGGAAILIRQNINHCERTAFAQDNIQATSVTVHDHRDELTLTAVYCVPKHNNKRQDYENFFKTLSNKFIAGGDYNARNVCWGSRLTTTKGRQLLSAMRLNNLHYLSIGIAIYWPSDVDRTSDLVDFCDTKDINTRLTTTTTCLDLASDHSPFIV